jgi:hypothetical protein
MLSVSQASGVSPRARAGLATAGLLSTHCMEDNERPYRPECLLLLKGSVAEQVPVAGGLSARVYWDCRMLWFCEAEVHSLPHSL